MIRSLLFDLDGTLIDTWRLYMEAYRRTFEEFYGRSFHAHETLALLALRPRSETWLLQKVLGAQGTVDAYTLFLRHYHALHDTHFDGAYAGVPEMLRQLRDRGYGIGVVTGKSRGAWTITEAKAGLVPFDVVVTESEVREPKPHPEGIMSATAALNGTAGDVVYVGDSLLDGEAAAAAGIPFWAAAWAKSSDEAEAFDRDARTQGAERVFTNPYDLLATLGTREP